MGLLTVSSHKYRRRLRRGYSRRTTIAGMFLVEPFMTSLKMFIVLKNQTVRNRELTSSYTSLPPRTPRDKLYQYQTGGKFSREDKLPVHQLILDSC